MFLKYTIISIEESLNVDPWLLKDCCQSALLLVKEKYIFSENQTIIQMLFVIFVQNKINSFVILHLSYVLQHYKSVYLNILITNVS